MSSLLHLSATPMLVAAATALSLAPLRRRAGRRRPDCPGPDGPRRLPPPLRIAHRVACVREAVHRRRPRGPIEPAAVADWVEALSAAVRRGATLRDAVSSTRPADLGVDRATEPLRHGIDRGLTVGVAVRRWSEHPGVAASAGERSIDHLGPLRPAATTLAVIADTGGSITLPLDRVAMALRRRAEHELERTTHAAQAAMSARVMTALPVAVLGLFLLIDDGVRRVVTTPAGLLVLTVGLALNATGGWWMRRIIRGAR